MLAALAKALLPVVPAAVRRSVERFAAMMLAEAVKDLVAWPWLAVNRLSGGAVPPPPAAAERRGSGEPGLGGVEPAARRWRVLLVHAHPLSGSFSAALANAAAAGLEHAGHEVDRLALYDDQGRPALQPCLTAEERAGYMARDPYPAPADDTRALVHRLQRADALVLVYPTWWFNLPAVLKGWVDRTFLPGVAVRRCCVACLGVRITSEAARHSFLSRLALLGLLSHRYADTT